MLRPYAKRLMLSIHPQVEPGGTCSTTLPPFEPTPNWLSLAKELPTSFHDFIAHADLVSRAIQTGVTPPNIRPKYFPKEFERDIKRAHAA